MSINPKFKPVDDFYQGENNPLSSPGLPAEAIRDDPGSLLIPTQSPTIPFKEKMEKPGYFETLGHAFSEYNEFAQAGRFIQREAQFNHPANDTSQDDFNPRDYKYLKDYPPDYWDWISAGQSPNEITARQQYVTEKVQEKEYFSSGAWSAQLLGGFGGAVTSPTSYLPFAASVKYASISQSVVKGMLQAAPTVALQTIAHEGFIQATEAGGNLEDFAINSLRDATFGVAFMGAGAGLGASFRGSQLWNVRKMANYTYEGVDFNHVIDETTGGVTGELKATAAPGIALNAAKLYQAQTFADSAMHNGFLFGIPGIQKIAGSKIIGSPIVKGLSHRFDTIKGFTDFMASHSILTKNILNGVAKPDSAEDILSAYNASSVEFSLNYKSHFLQENGIEGGFNVRNATKALKQRAFKQNTISEEDFGIKVIDSILSKEYNQTKSINAAAKLYTDQTDSTWLSFAQSKGLDLELPQVRNAKGYFTFTADTIAMTKRPEEFRQVAVNAYTVQDNLIEEVLTPINNAKAFLKQLEEHKLSGQAHDRSMVNEIARAREALRQEELAFDKKVRENENLSILLEDINFLSLEDADILRGYLKPLEESQANISIQKGKVASLKKKYSSSKSGAKKTVTKEGTLGNIEKMKKLEQEINQAEDELRTLEGQYQDIKMQLDTRALKGEIPSKFFHKDENVVTFRNPEERPVLRKPYGSYEARYNAAEALRQTYLNQTPEQVQQSILGSMMPSKFANPIKKRTSLIPMQDMHNARFISTNIPQSVSAYNRTLGRHIALNTVFKGVNIMEGELGPIGIARSLSEERIKLEKQIELIKDTKKRQKELLKLDKDFKDAQQFMKSMYEVFMGYSSASENTLRIARALRNFAASTKLGGVPIAQMTDVGAIILKHGLWPYLRSGLKPFIQSLNGYMDTELATDMKNNAAHAHLALQHIGNGYTQKYYDSGSIGDVPIGTHLESALEKVAHLSGNFYGTNFIENANQRITATIMQSQIMQDLYAYKAGTLTKTREQALLTYGLNPKEWADRFIKNFENSTGYKDSLGAYQSRYWSWEDNEAVARMAATLRRGVYDTIVQRGLFTSPFWSNNPIPSMIFMFHGWGFSAFAKYTVPMMQRAEADKLMGIVFMLGLGAMTDPLRKINNGHKFEESNDDTWFGNAFTVVSNSGILGHTPDMLQTMNRLVDGHLLPVTTERYRSWNKWSTLGPVAGISDDLVALYKMAVTQNWNKKDFKKAARLVPLEGTIGLRRLVNKYFDSTDLPDTYRDAKEGK